MKKLLIFVCLFYSVNLHADNITAKASGNWYDGSTWPGGTVPSAADIVTIPSGISVVINMSTDLKAPWNNPKTVNIYGSLQLNGNDPLIKNPVSLNIYSGGTFYDNTDFNEYYIPETSYINVQTGGLYKSLNPSGPYPPYETNFVDASKSGVYYTLPSVSMNGPFTVTVAAGKITYQPQTSLPLKLINFSGQNDKENVVLKWETANEKNTSNTIIERSADGKTFSKIGSVNPKGGTDNHYTYTDNDPLNGSNYYKLEFADEDGSVTHSKIVLVKTSSEHVGVYPNPARNYINVTSTKGGRLTIYNSGGKLVKEQKIIPGTTKVDIQSLITGIYFYKINSLKGEFIKENF